MQSKFDKILQVLTNNIIYSYIYISKFNNLKFDKVFHIYFILEVVNYTENVKLILIHLMYDHNK